MSMTSDYADRQEAYNRQGYTKVLTLFAEAGITGRQIAEITVELQVKHLPEMTVEQVIPVIDNMLKKDEVQDAIIMGFTLDSLAEQKLLPEPLLSKVRRDEGLFGLDEALVANIYNLYGQISVTNFGHVDRIKAGIIGKIDKVGKTSEDVVTTFRDDIVGALSAGACGYFAHNPRVLLSGK
jgi:Phosphatidylglycerophosphatase A and related proteins